MEEYGNFKLKMTTRNRPRVLMRIIMVLNRQGFEAVKFKVEAGSSPSEQTLSMRVQGDTQKWPHVQKQLSKLVDICDLQLPKNK